MGVFLFQKTFTKTFISVATLKYIICVEARDNEGSVSIRQCNVFGFFFRDGKEAFDFNERTADKLVEFLKE